MGKQAVAIFLRQYGRAIGNTPQPSLICFPVFIPSAFFIPAVKRHSLFFTAILCSLRNQHPFTLQSATIYPAISALLPCNQYAIARGTGVDKFRHILIT